MEIRRCSQAHGAAAWSQGPWGSHCDVCLGPAAFPTASAQDWYPGLPWGPLGRRWLNLLDQTPKGLSVLPLQQPWWPQGQALGGH